MKPETRICEFPRERVCITSVISSGRFYEMCKADAWNIDGEKEHAEVVIKKSIGMCEVLFTSCNALIEAEIMKEIQTLHYIQGNKNVVKIIGCCTDQSPKYIILEQMPENLKNYLQFQCNTSTEHVSEVTQKDMFSFMMDIARGMEHLSKLKIIHRYLAAKHILISSNNTCKVSNFTYASNVINDDRFYEKTKDNFPYQWMAIETLLKKRFDWTSDVWSFGVVLWEIVTFGCSPHGSMTKKQVTDMIRMGKRLTKPPNCGKELYSAINSCWIHNVTNRPHFSQMIETINSLMNDGKAHIDVSNPGEILNIYQHNLQFTV
ncbi:tyrosine kinase receptor Cad96Ca-like [Saccoglossus kowalevskii]